MNKIVSIVLVFIMMLALCVPCMADTDVISFAKITPVMPDIKVEVTGTGYENSEISAFLDTEELEVGNIKAYNSSELSTRVYILVDLSTSMRNAFWLVKQNINKYIDTLGEKDSCVLIAFGEKTVETLLDGTEDRATAKTVVDSLQPNEYGTLFYEGLNKAYQLSAAGADDYDREYALVFSDGIDVQKGSSTFEEVKALYDSHSLPLYAACAYHATKDGADKFGELARSSGGKFSIIGDQNDFSDFVAEINDVTLIDLKASSNFADGKEKQLSLKVGDSQITCNVPIIKSTPDTVAPTVIDFMYDNERDVFVVGYSEKVKGAGEKIAYKITDYKGSRLTIDSVFYSEANDRYEIKTVLPVYNGTYTIEFSGITDISQEANSLSENFYFDVINSHHFQEKVVEEPEEKDGFPLWLIILIVAIVLILVSGIIVLAIFLGRRNRQSEEISIIQSYQNNGEVVDYMQAPPTNIKHHIRTNDAMRIKLRVKTGKESEQIIETNINSSLIVGRSDVCDVYIDDSKLSRQHFVIECDNGVLYVMDLQSRNGTMLNGIRTNCRQQLRSGDKITAGLSDIVIMF